MAEERIIDGMTYTCFDSYKVHITDYTKHEKNLERIYYTTEQTNEYINIVDTLKDKLPNQWMLDAIEIDENISWKDILSIEFPPNFNGFRLHIQPLQVLTSHNPKNRIWKFPHHLLFSEPFYLFKYNNQCAGCVRIIIKTTHTCEVKLYHKCIYYNKDYSGYTYYNSYNKKRYLSYAYEVMYRYLREMNSNVLHGNVICTGVLVSSSKILENVKLSVPHGTIFNYNRTMLHLYATNFKKIWDSNDEMYFKNKLIGKNIPNDIYCDIVKHIDNDNTREWWWIPFSPYKDIWDWTSTEEMSINLSKYSNYPMTITFTPLHEDIKIYIMINNILRLGPYMSGGSLDSS